MLESPILTGHQPEFMPWLGYLSKAQMGDIYYMVDHIQFHKEVFQNRNKIRIKNEPGWQWLTVPIKNARKIQLWHDVKIDNSKPWKRKHLNAIKMSYSKTPYFTEIFPEIEQLYTDFEGDKLIDFIKIIVKYAFKKFDITTPIRYTSEIEGIDGKKSDLIISMCKSCNAKTFIFGEVGKTYIDWEKFKDIKPVFQEFTHPKYTQTHGDLVSNMSFIDLLFNHGDDSKKILTKSKYNNE
tara:strand:- start:1573 stop:2286 length:714 start_codon:yes stop_codon:yes gene_type:complete